MHPPHDDNGRPLRHLKGSGRRHLTALRQNQRD
jgi:hypothetical protein